jgi:hypothetical protein
MVKDFCINNTINNNLMIYATKDARTDGGRYAFFSFALFFFLHGM